MRWLASSWLFVLFVVGMARMHGGHGTEPACGPHRHHGRRAAMTVLGSVQ